MKKKDRVKQEPILWWNSLTFEEKFYKVIPWLKSQNKNVTDRHPNDLTKEEIKELHEINFK